MMNYGSWAPPPRRRRTPGLMLVAIAVLLVLVVAVLVVGRDVLARSPASASPTADTPATSAAGQLTLGACIDNTASIVSGFGPSIRSDLSQAIGSLAPPSGPVDTSAPSSGAPVTLAQPAVSLTIRPVTTYSAASTVPNLTVAVPGIPGLNMSRPDPTATNYDSLLQTWSTGYGVVTAARKAATSAAASGASTIAAMPLSGGWSGISSCVSGLLLTVPQAGQHSYLLASDLEENVAPQLQGSFHGSPLAIVQTCDSGNLSLCHDLLQRFEAKMQQLDVGAITVVRPEDAAQAIEQWVRTGKVSQ
jgi:hypothetical protein